MNDSEGVAIFWDYENCPTPSNSNISGYAIVNNIRSLASPFGGIKVFKAYLDISEQLPASKALALRSELQSSGVSLIDCPHNGRKDAADKMMIVDMLAHAIDNQPPSTIFLISGDRDFAYALSVLRFRRYRVVLVTLANAHASLTSQASLIFDWNRDIISPIEGPLRSPYSRPRDLRIFHERQSSFELGSLGAGFPFSVPAPGFRTRSDEGLLDRNETFGTTNHVRDSPDWQRGYSPFPGTSNGPQQTTTSRPPPSYPTPPGQASPKKNRNSAQTLPQNNGQGFGMNKVPFAAASASPWQGAGKGVGYNPTNVTPVNRKVPLVEEDANPISATIFNDTPADPAPNRYSVPVIEPAPILSTYVPPSPVNRLHFQTASSSSAISGGVSLSTQTHEAQTRPSTAPVQAPTPASKPARVPPPFWSLVQTLRKFRTKGNFIPLRSVVALEISKGGTDVYKKAGVDGFSKYAAMAEKEGFIVLGGTGGKAWIQLKPEWFGD